MNMLSMEEMDLYCGPVGESAVPKRF